MKRSLLFTTLLLLSSCSLIPGPGGGKRGKWNYPEARKADVVEDFHGTAVPDPYQWMEDPESPETKAWVDAQNEITEAYLSATPAREAIRARLTELWNYPRYGLPRRVGDRYYYSKNDGLQNQSVLYMVKELDGKPVVVLDPNTFSEDGTVALTTQAFSRDGKLLAYGRNASGSDWGTLHIRDLDAGGDIDEVFKNMRYAGVAWKHDNSGFYYSKYPSPGTVPDEDLYFFQKIYWHQLRTPVAQDKLVFEVPAQKDLGLHPIITEDGKYLILWVWRGTDDRNGLYFREAESDGEFIHLFEVGEARYDLIGNVGTTFYIHTELDAPRGRIMALDVARQRQWNWYEVIPESKDVISSAALINDHLVVQVMHDAHELLKIFDLKGNFVREVKLPTKGSIGGPSGRQEDTEFFFSFNSFLYPAAIYRYDFTTDQVAIFHKPAFDFDISGYETNQVFYTAKDGTRVPMFLTHRKGLDLDGNNPVLLYAYGGFNAAILPGFSARRVVLI